MKKTLAALLTIVIAVLVAIVTPMAQQINVLTFEWQHHTLNEDGSQTLEQTVPDPKGGPSLKVTYQPTTFTIYESHDLANWKPIGQVTGTNRFNYTYAQAPTQVFFACTASNSFNGETSFSPIAAAQFLRAAWTFKLPSSQ